MEIKSPLQTTTFIDNNIFMNKNEIYVQWLYFKGSLEVVDFYLHYFWSYPHLAKSSHHTVNMLILFTHGSKPCTKFFATIANEQLCVTSVKTMITVFILLVFEVSWVLQGVVLICETLSYLADQCHSSHH